MKQNISTFISALIACMILVTAALALDANHDGMDDLWQQRYGVAPFAGALDPDGDGRINFVEALNMTDPLNTANPGLGMVYINDSNPADGLDDHWQARFGLTAADKFTDADNDGRSALEESYVGSDPFTADEPWGPAGQTQGSGAAAGPQEYILTMPWTVPGWRYTLESSDTLMQNEWGTAAVASGQNVSQWGTGNAISVTATTGGAERKFFRWKVDSPDDDGDFLSNWAEMQLGLDPLDDDSDNDGYVDGAEVAGNSDASNSDSNPVSAAAGENGKTERAVYLAQLTLGVTNYWNRSRYEGGSTSSGSISWWDDTPASGFETYEVFEPRWAPAYGNLSFPLLDDTAWQGVWGAVTARGYLLTNSDPGQYGFDSGHASLTHKVFCTQTQNSDLNQPWAVTRRFLAYKKKRAIPLNEPQVTELSDVRMESFTILRGASRSSRVLRLEPEVLNREDNTEHLGWVEISTPNSPMSHDNISMPQWIMLPKGEAQTVSFWMNHHFENPLAYQAAGGEVTPARVIRQSEHFVDFTSNTAGEDGSLNIGVSVDEQSNPVFAPDVMGNRLVNFAVLPRKIMDVTVIPIIYLSAGGTQAAPPNVPSATSLQSYLNSVFLKQANIICTVEVAPAVPVYYDVGISLVASGAPWTANDGVFEMYWDRFRTVAQRKSPEELAILAGAPPDPTANVTVYYVCCPGGMYSGDHLTEQAALLAQAGETKNNGLDGGLRWADINGIAMMFAENGSDGKICYVRARDDEIGKNKAINTIAHEIGHLLGLQHTIDYGGSRGVGYLPYADNEYRLMSGVVGPKKATSPIRLNKAEWMVINASNILTNGN